MTVPNEYEQARLARIARNKRILKVTPRLLREWHPRRRGRRLVVQHTFMDDNDRSWASRRHQSLREAPRARRGRKNPDGQLMTAATEGRRRWERNPLAVLAGSRETTAICSRWSVMTLPSRDPSESKGGVLFWLWGCGMLLLLCPDDGSRYAAYRAIIVTLPPNPCQTQASPAHHRGRDSPRLFKHVPHPEHVSRGPPATHLEDPQG